MESRDRFEILIDTINKAEILPKDRIYLTRGLSYFRQQSLCDYDRRKRSDLLEKEWFEFKKLLSGDQKMLRRFDKMFWSDLEFSLGITKNVMIMPEFPKEKKSPFENYDKVEFFYYLGKKIEREMKPTPEKWILLLAVYCLRAEAALPRIRREQEMIKKVWKFVHPQLKTLGYMDEFKNEDRVRNDVRLFVAGSLLDL